MSRKIPDNKTTIAISFLIVSSVPNINGVKNKISNDGNPLAIG